MRSTITLLLVLLLAPMAIHAQDEAAEAPETPRFLMFNQAMVLGTDMGTVNQLADSMMKPVLDEMTDEGLIANWGILTHNWGDEWNWNWYMFTKDHASFVSAWNEFIRRINEKWGSDGPSIIDHIVDHKDNMFYVRHHKLRPPVEGEAPARFLMLNQGKVRMKDMGNVNAIFDSTGAVVLDEMLAEGTIHFWGQSTHFWGDEWNWNFWFGSDDHADFVNDWDTFVEKMRGNNGFREMMPYSKGHKDNLYYIRHAK